MLTKLMKHEFKATYRTFLPIYIGLVVITAFACISSLVMRDYHNPILEIALGLGIIIVVIGYIFVFISPYIFLSLRFYRTTATREAYLTFTVPADTKTILLAKFIVTFLWTILTSLLWIASFLILIECISEGQVDLWYFFSENETVIWQILTMVFAFANNVLMIFTAISLSQLVRDHRVIASIGFYAAIYTVQQIISIIALIPFMIKSMNLFSALEAETNEAAIQAELMSEQLPVYLLSIGLSLGMSVAMFFLSNYMWKRKLNLL